MKLLKRESFVLCYTFAIGEFLKQLPLLYTEIIKSGNKRHESFANLVTYSYQVTHEHW